MGAISATNAKTIATANPGCVIQIENGANNLNLDLDICFVIDLLDKAYSKDYLK